MSTSEATPFQSRFLRRFGRFVRVLPKGRHRAFQLAWRAAGSPEEFVGEFDGSPFVVDPQDRHSSMQLFLWGVHEAAVTEVFLALLKPTGCVLDIGSNSGYFSILAAHRTRGRVVSYEPLPRNFRFLEATRAAANLDNWLPLQIAISDRNGPLEFDPRGDDEGRSGWGTISPSGTVVVDGRTLDSECARLGLDSIDLLKMDIEGHEVEAFVGMSNLLRHRRIANLIVELHPRLASSQRLAALTDSMKRYGYHGYRVRDEFVRSTRFSQPDGPLLPSRLQDLEPTHLTDDGVHVLWSAEPQRTELG